MDAIALHQYGFDCAVASLGTALTEEHAQLLAKYTQQVVLTYDGDEAGQNATRRAIPMLERAGLQVKILRMKGAKDPDEFLKRTAQTPSGRCSISRKTRRSTGCKVSKISLISTTTPSASVSSGKRRSSSPPFPRWWSGMSTDAAPPRPRASPQRP